MQVLYGISARMKMKRHNYNVPRKYSYKVNFLKDEFKEKLRQLKTNIQKQTKKRKNEKDIRKEKETERRKRFKEKEEEDLDLWERRVWNMEMTLTNTIR